MKFTNEESADIIEGIREGTADRAQVLELLKQITADLATVVELPGIADSHGQAIAAAALLLTVWAMDSVGLAVPPAKVPKQ